MRIAYITLAPFISGAERSLQQMLINCHSHGINPIVIAAPKSPIIEWCEDNHIPVYSIDLSLISLRKPWKYLYAQYKIRQVLIKQQIDLIHSNQIWSYRFLAPNIKKLNIASVCHLRDPVGPDCAWWLKGHVDVLICISKHIEREFLKSCQLVKYNNAVTIINPISSPEEMSAQQVTYYKNKAQTVLGIQNVKLIFGFIGQIIPVKGLPSLLKALSKLNYSNWALLVAGHDPRPNENHIQECQALAKKLNISNNIHFLGFLDNSKCFYEAIDLVVVPSIEEPLGRVPLEAGGYYKPAIVSSAGGLPETVQDGHSGWIFPIEEPEQLLTSLMQASNADLPTMGINARLWKEKISNPTKYMANMKNIYNDAISAHKIRNK